MISIYSNFCHVLSSNLYSSNYDNTKLNYLLRNDYGKAYTFILRFNKTYRSGL